MPLYSRNVKVSSASKEQAIRLRAPAESSDAAAASGEAFPASTVSCTDLETCFAHKALAPPIKDAK